MSRKFTIVVEVLIVGSGSVTVERGPVYLNGEVNRVLKERP